MSDRLREIDSEADIAATKHACRTCGRALREESATFPFCSDRCRLADLGKWFNEGYRMSRPVERDEELSE